MTGLVLETFGGPGGWAQACRALGLLDVGIEFDAAACATRRAAGHRVVRADVADFPVEHLAGRVWGSVNSPPCTTFSAAGDQAGVALMAMLSGLIGNMFAGRDSRSAYKAAMTAELTRSEWGAELAAAKRAAKISAAVASAALVAEPARFIAACHPEWIALEQVPAVLPLWQVYAAELRKMGYSAWCGKLNAADYGVPQTRERAILIASRVRKVSRPEPTHYDPRKGDQLWGTPWVSMAAALGWGATGRPGPSVTAGGTQTGGAEPFARGGREALEAAQEAGEWALRAGNQPHAALRPAPAPAIAFGHNAARMQWVLHTNRDQRPDGSRQTADPSTAPAPAPALTGKSGGQWVLHRSRGEGMLEREGRGGRRDHPADEPAPTITGAGGKPGANLTWVRERPATTVQGDPRVGRPGHKDRDRGESQFAQDSVRITVQEAAILQSFPAGYPFQGSKTARFRQVGDAWCPLAAIHVLGMAAGIDPHETAERYIRAVYGPGREAA